MYTTRNLKDVITVWSRNSNDGYGGFSYDAPTQIKGRWEDRTEVIRTITGEELNSRAVIFLDSDVKIGDYIYMGTSVEANPTQVSNAEEVLKYSKTADLRNVIFERKVWV